MASKNTNLKPVLFLDAKTIFLTIKGDSDLYPRFHRGTVHYGYDNLYGEVSIRYPIKIWDYLAEMYDVYFYYRSSGTGKDSVRDIIMSRVPFEASGINHIEDMTYSPTDCCLRINQILHSLDNPRFVWATVMESEYYIGFLKAYRSNTQSCRGIFTGTEGLNLQDCQVLEDFYNDVPSDVVLSEKEEKIKSAILADGDYYDSLEAYGYS